VCGYLHDCTELCCWGFSAPIWLSHCLNSFLINNMDCVNRSLINLYQSTLRYDTEDSHVRSHSRENLVSCCANHATREQFFCLSVCYRTCRTRFSLCAANIPTLISLGGWNCSSWFAVRKIESRAKFKPQEDCVRGGLCPRPKSSQFMCDTALIPVFDVEHPLKSEALR
jgi:hypothetical protein